MTQVAAKRQNLPRGAMGKRLRLPVRVSLQRTGRTRGSKTPEVAAARNGWRPATCLNWPRETPSSHPETLLRGWRPATPGIHNRSYFPGPHALAR